MSERRIWKFPISVYDESTITMPQGAELLTAQMQRDELQLWALVDPDAGPESRSFRLAGTGHALTGDLRFIATVQLLDGDLVLHLFEKMCD